jgi:hypothetical protein
MHSVVGSLAGGTDCKSKAGTLPHGSRHHIETMDLNTTWVFCWYDWFVGAKWRESIENALSICAPNMTVNPVVSSAPDAAQPRAHGDGRLGKGPGGPVPCERS